VLAKGNSFNATLYCTVVMDKQLNLNGGMLHTFMDILKSILVPELSIHLDSPWSGDRQL
jgi:hypothetical protein